MGVKNKILFTPCKTFWIWTSQKLLNDVLNVSHKPEYSEFRAVLKTENIRYSLNSCCRHLLFLTLCTQKCFLLTTLYMIWYKSKLNETFIINKFWRQWNSRGNYVVYPTPEEVNVVFNWLSLIFPHGIDRISL